MRVLTVNCGSASVKLAAFEVGPDTLTLLAEEHRAAGGELDAALREFVAKLGHTPDAIAHRVVHGGLRFTQPLRIDAGVESGIEALSELAPLHNGPALEAIRAARRVCGSEVPQVAAFDTAFFASLPRVAAEYAVPAAVTAQGVRRYGFHGLAHEALWRRWCELEPSFDAGGRLITVQLGSGCSMTAIARSRPLDTTMGFSPLEGLVMRTRSGDIDPAVVPYLARRTGRSCDEIVDLLNRESGLAGLSGTRGDAGALLESPDENARFAIELYSYRARKYLGAFLAVLGGCDGIVFGGGVGEHVPAVRANILAGFEWAGARLDVRANAEARGAEARISASDSAVALYVVPVDEERVLAEAARQVLAQQ